MAPLNNLPCDGDGVCMVCKTTPPGPETLGCKTCGTPWHVTCLSSPPKTLEETASWECPDCTDLDAPVAVETGTGLVAAIRAIESDASLTDKQKAEKRQELLGGTASGENDGGGVGDSDVFKVMSGAFNCSFCMHLPDRPVSTPCGHNFCLKCFQKWVGQGKRTCVVCRSDIPLKMAREPRINSSLVIAIRMAKMNKSSSGAAPKPYHFVHNQNRPDKAFTTERAKKTGKANACSGRIFVTIPADHFGPILPEHDPIRGLGVLVGETWEDRLECRQWGAHLPHVAGIAGQSDYGAQSVALSGGYEDDEDHGDWFLYTGSGGRDLSGNKRTNKVQSFDQTFDKSNEALRVSCRKGYPVRVVRSHKEKRSSYAPEKGVRYDGIYRIEKCWRKPGEQKMKVCRYLFVRCDNDPAPWTSDEHGDRPRPLPAIKELKDASDITERKGEPCWDYDSVKGCWMWKKPPPASRKPVCENLEDGTVVRKVRRKTQTMSVNEKLLKEFSCLLCHKVMVLPLTTPCAHNFCKSCLEDVFAGQTKERICEGRTLRARKNVMKCPSCSNDISEFLQNPQVNRELMTVIETLQQQAKETEENSEPAEEEPVTDENHEDITEEVVGKDGDSDEAQEDAEVAETGDETVKEAKENEVAKPAAKGKSKSVKKKEDTDGNIAVEVEPLQEAAANGQTKRSSKRRKVVG